VDFDHSKISLSFQKPNSLRRIDQDCLFGELDSHIAEIISSIDSKDGIRLQIYCRTINRRAAQGKKGSRKTREKECQYVMNTIIYGPENLHNNVGDYLAACRIYLQDPIDCDRNVQYSNPQFLCRAGGRVMTYEFASLNAAPRVEKIISQDDIFSQLSCDDYLSLTEAPDPINTTLYRYGQGHGYVTLLH
jgi:SWI/SNF-related matrix-associated actin-dependent regulator of chromatin subfamily A3